jgi:hypothetical protein
MMAGGVAGPALLGAGADRAPEQAVGAGGACTRVPVFDLPAGAARPALSVTERALPDRMLEWFRIGDEDSLLHQATLLSLAPATAAGPRAGHGGAAATAGAPDGRPSARP